jgi:NTE family protein
MTDPGAQRGRRGSGGLPADLVCEGGGVKGSALVGAVQALVDSGYRFRRYAGTSAGAIVTSLLAAGWSPPDLKTVLTHQDLAQFQDVSPWFAHVREAGEFVGLLAHEGLYKGDYLHAWIKDQLAAHGVHTWGDLKEHDPGSALPQEQRYTLLVVVSDVTRGRMLRLPWDYYELRGIDPDDLPVADAVRASASIPFFFRPFHQPVAPQDNPGGESRLVFTDGGMLSNYPIDVFDRPLGDPTPPRWPTIGVKLSARSQALQAWADTSGALQLTMALLKTMINAHDRAHLDDPSVCARTVFVDTTGYCTTDFTLDNREKLELWGRGNQAAAQFLATWDWNSWLSTYRPAPGGTTLHIPNSPTVGAQAWLPTS